MLNTNEYWTVITRIGWSVKLDEFKGNKAKLPRAQAKDSL